MSDFTVSVRVKPYVKQFLINNCGNPVDLSKIPEYKLYLRRLLKKPSVRRNSDYKNELKKSYETVDIIISEDDFYRYGWELTRADSIAFSREVELRVKFIMRTSLEIFTGMGLTIKQSIIRFQDIYNFSEDSWSHEAIRKDYYRNSPMARFNLEAEILKTVEAFILDKLSHAGDNIKYCSL